MRAIVRILVCPLTYINEKQSEIASSKNGQLRTFTENGCFDGCDSVVKSEHESLLGGVTIWNLWMLCDIDKHHVIQWGRKHGSVGVTLCQWWPYNVDQARSGEAMHLRQSQTVDGMGTRWADFLIVKAQDPEVPYHLRSTKVTPPNVLIRTFPVDALHKSMRIHTLGCIWRHFCWLSRSTGDIQWFPFYKQPRSISEHCCEVKHWWHGLTVTYSSLPGGTHRIRMVVKDGCRVRLVSVEIDTVLSSPRCMVDTANTLSLLQMASIPPM